MKRVQVIKINMETKWTIRHITYMPYQELNELEGVEDDVKNRIELFFTNSNFDEKQRKTIIDLLNEFYSIGLVDGLSTHNELNDSID